MATHCSHIFPVISRQLVVRLNISGGHESCTRIMSAWFSLLSAKLTPEDCALKSVLALYTLHFPPWKWHKWVVTQQWRRGSYAVFCSHGMVNDWPFENVYRSSPEKWVCHWEPLMTCKLTLTGGKHHICLWPFVVTTTISVLRRHLGPAIPLRLCGKI